MRRLPCVTSFAAGLLTSLAAVLIALVLGSASPAPGSADAGKSVTVKVFGLDRPQPNTIQKAGATVSYIDQNNRLCVWYRGGPYFIQTPGGFDPQTIQPAAEGVVFYSDKAGTPLAWVYTGH